MNYSHIKRIEHLRYRVQRLVIWAFDQPLWLLHGRHYRRITLRWAFGLRSKRAA